MTGMTLFCFFCALAGGSPAEAGAPQQGQMITLHKRLHELHQKVYIPFFKCMSTKGDQNIWILNGANQKHFKFWVFTCDGLTSNTRTSLFESFICTSCKDFFEFSIESCVFKVTLMVEFKNFFFFIDLGSLFIKTQKNASEQGCGDLFDPP